MLEIYVSLIKIIMMSGKAIFNFCFEALLHWNVVFRIFDCPLSLLLQKKSSYHQHQIQV